MALVSKASATLASKNLLAFSVIMLVCGLAPGQCQRDAAPQPSHRQTSRTRFYTISAPSEASARSPGRKQTQLTAWNSGQLFARQLSLEPETSLAEASPSHGQEEEEGMAAAFAPGLRQRPDSAELRAAGTKGRPTRRPSSGVKGARQAPGGAAGTKQNRHHDSVPSSDWTTGGGAVLPRTNWGTSGGPANRSLAQPRRQAERKKLVCYYGTWAVYRPDAGKFSVEDIDPFLCTHVIYGFTGLSFDNVIKPLDPWNDLEDNYGKGAMKRFTNLKRINPELKTLVAIGGWNEGSIKYSKMASEPEARARFVQSVVAFLAKYNFDGLDLDWEYPGSRGGASYDKQNFVRLLRELSEAFKPHGYLLTAAVSAGKWFIDPAYDIGQVSKYLDLINLMAYDYHGGWESKTGMNAPLFSSPRHDVGASDKQLNVNWSVNYWLAQGAQREKLLLGVGSYGRSFTLDRESENGLNAGAGQKGRAGPYTREPGSLGYNEICSLLGGGESNSWTVVRDPDYLAPYAYTNNGQRQWVGYDDQQSLALKAQYAKSMGLGGVMMWSIETDDFHGHCHGGQKFPLLNTIRRVLDGADPTGSGGRPRPASTTTSTSTTTTTTTTSTTSTTTSRPGHEVEEVDEEEQRPQPHERPKPPTTRRPSTTRRPAASSTRRPASVAPSTSSPPRPPSGSSSTKRPPPPPPQASSSTRRPAGGQQFVCHSDGMFADPNNCRKFIRCLGSNSAFAQQFSFDCGPGTAFSEQLQACDHLRNVPNCAHAPPNNSRRRLVQLVPVGALPLARAPLLVLPAYNGLHHHHLRRHLMLGHHHQYLGHGPLVAHSWRRA